MRASPRPRSRPCSARGKAPATDPTVIIHSEARANRHSGATPLRSQLVHFTSGQQKSSGDELLRAVGRDEIRLVVPLLPPKNLALRADAMSQARPGFSDRGQVHFAIEDTLIDPPCQSETEKACAAGFRGYENLAMGAMGTGTRVPSFSETVKAGG